MTGPRAWIAYGLKVLALAVAYGAAAVFGLTWSVTPGGGGPIWPASGLGLAVLLIGGVELAPGILLGRLGAAILINAPYPLWVDLLLASGAMLGAALPAWAARRFRLIDPTLATLPSMLWLVVAAAASAGVSAAVGTVALGGGGAPPDRLAAATISGSLGAACGVLLLTPILLVWTRLDAWRLSRLETLHLAVCLACMGVATWLVFVEPPFQPTPTWYLFPFLVWSALAFNVRGVSLSLAITAAMAVYGSVNGVGAFSAVAPDAASRLLLSQQFVAITAVTMLVMAAVADERRGRQRILLSEQRLLEERRALQTLNATGSAIAAELDLDRVVQMVTDAGVSLTGARFGAFFYNLAGPEQETFTLFSLSGAPRSAFERFGMPRSTPVFTPTFAGEGIVRSDDITLDPRYGRNAPHAGMPEGHLPVRSYLAVPVKSRSGEVIGGLLFGHPDAGVFTARTEWIIAGVAAQAAIALDNARLYKGAQAEIEERKAVEARQDLLINELNHRVKNTLATVQSIAAQTLRPLGGQVKESLTARIIALSRVHDVITARTWQGADLAEVVDRAVEPFNDAGGRFSIEGPSVWLLPRAALAIAMALHELGTNATKYGALSVPAGRITIVWAAEAQGRLKLTWTEQDGPRVAPPETRGFGSRLIERGLRGDLEGDARLIFAETGLICEITAQVGPGAADGAFLKMS